MMSLQSLLSKPYRRAAIFLASMFALAALCYLLTMSTEDSTPDVQVKDLIPVCDPTICRCLREPQQKNTTPLNVDPKGPVIYVVTPTYPRMEQIAELTRMAQTLMHVPNLVWILAEDAKQETPEVKELLLRSGMKVIYLLSPMPEKYLKNTYKPKGVSSRLAGLKWVQEHGHNNDVLYFADDDNSYDIRIFEEMRYTKKVSMWPVGLLTNTGVSTPVVRQGKVVDFYDGWVSNRAFPLDMACFAINVGFLKSRHNVTMPYVAGYEEDGFLKSLNFTIKDIEAKASNCTKVYVWHTKTQKNKLPKKVPDDVRKKFNGTNIFSLPYVY